MEIIELKSAMTKTKTLLSNRLEMTANQISELEDGQI